MEFDRLVNTILESETPQGMSTYWQDGDMKVTIRQVIKYLKDNSVPVKDVSVSKIKPIIIDQDYKGESKDRVSKANLSHPIIVIKKNGKYKSILDGNHRAFKALDSKAKTIKVQEIDLDSPDIPSEYKKLFNYRINPLFKK